MRFSAIQVYLTMQRLVESAAALRAPQETKCICRVINPTWLDRCILLLPMLETMSALAIIIHLHSQRPGIETPCMLAAALCASGRTQSWCMAPTAQTVLWRRTTLPLQTLDRSLSTPRPILDAPGSLVRCFVFLSTTVMAFDTTQEIGLHGGRW